MGDNAVNESITLPIEEEAGGEETSSANSFPMVIRELGEALFQNYEEKDSNLTDENILGIIRCNVLNDYVHRRYGYRFSSLDEMVTRKKALVISRNGYGIEKLTEALKAIQANFTQTEIPLGITNRLMGRR